MPGTRSREEPPAPQESHWRHQLAELSGAVCAAQTVAAPCRKFWQQSSLRSHKCSCLLPLCLAMPASALLATLLALLSASQASATPNGVLGGAADGSAATSASSGGRSLLGVDSALLKLIKLPPGFKISAYTDDFVDARNLAVGNRGSSKPVVVYVSTTGDKVQAKGLGWVGGTWQRMARITPFNVFTLWPRVRARPLSAHHALPAPPTQPPPLSGARAC